MNGRAEIGGPVHIREMTEGDLDGVLEIERMTFPSPWSRALFERELVTPFARSFVGLRKETGQLAGYLCFWLVEQEGHILNLAVHPQHRGQRIGSRLLGYGVEFCRKQGVQADHPGGPAVQLPSHLPVPEFSISTPGDPPPVLYRQRRRCRHHGTGPGRSEAPLNRMKIFPKK